jgi:hypothetical protein
MINTINDNTSSVKCRKYVPVYPDLSPSINSLSVNSSVYGIFTVITIDGDNFSIFGPMGYSRVNFGQYKGLSVSFLGSKRLSFVVPSNAIVGTYGIQVVNYIYPKSLYSNTVNFNVL